ncbi:MAG: response regulator [Burkholderiales bacterium]|nr:response regulator [Burkholderiales bacterium]
MSLRAYVVEDNASIRESLLEALVELAGTVPAGTASNEKDAIAWLLDPAHGWDLAIVDLALDGGGSGLNVLKALRGRDPRQKMVVLTGSASLDVRRQCESAGSDRVFDKSMETEDLLDYCQQLARDAQ